MNCHESPSSESRIVIVPCGNEDRGADMKKLVAVFRNFANAPKIRKLRFFFLI